MSDDSTAIFDSANRTILVVDDTPANLNLLNQCLKKRGYQTRCAVSGKVALDYLASHRPDIILLDILMPGMSGYEVCQAIKKQPDIADIPIIFISAINEAFDKVKAFSLGGVDYITKPFQIDEVYARVKNQLTIQAQRQHIEAQNRALKESNDRLQRFANILAHDLKQPIQSIVFAVEILEDLYGDRFTGEAGKYLEHIDRASTDMSDTIDGLYSFSSIDAHQQNFADVDCSEVLESVRNSLRATLTDLQVELEWGELPSVCGDRSLLAQLFQNLVANAIKFRKDDLQPRVSIRASRVSTDALPDADFGASYTATRDRNEFVWLFQVADQSTGTKPDGFELQPRHEADLTS